MRQVSVARAMSGSEGALVLVRERKVGHAEPAFGEFGHQQHPRLLASGQRNAPQGERLLAREQGDAVTSALEVDGTAEPGVHAGEPSEFGGDEAALGAACGAVDLLQRYEVGSRAADDVGCARKVAHVVRTDAVADVVAHQDDVMRFGAGAGGCHGCGGEQGRQDTGRAAGK